MFKKTILLNSFILSMVAFSNAAYIDFTNSSFSSSQGKTSYSVENYANTGIGVELVANPNGAKLTYNVRNGGLDGIGINDDEITGGTSELLYVHFNQTIDLTRIDITDLFTEPYQEVGLYRIDGTTTWITFKSDLSDFPVITNGEKSLQVNYSDITGISFKAGNNSNYDFSLRGLEVSSNVPEPGMISLFGMGILALSGVRLFRRKK